jgi:exo-1,4-beta-D-glucosaminidase
MLNNAWPSMIWHLYDYYLRPGGGYFGTKKACEPVHVQYSYDDRSIVVVNGTGKPIDGTVVAKVVDIDSSVKFSREVAVHVEADALQRLFTVPDIPGLSSTYFVDLRLSAAGKPVSSNLYWLSSKMDDLDWEKSTWYVTPVKGYADFNALRTLPAARITTSMSAARRGDEEIVRVTATNPGKTLAFFVHLQLMKGNTGEEVLPVAWSDNYVALLPGETRVLSAACAAKDLGGLRPVLVVTGWNLPGRTSRTSPASPR